MLIEISLPLLPDENDIMSVLETDRLLDWFARAKEVFETVPEFKARMIQRYLLQEGRVLAHMSFKLKHGQQAKSLALCLAPLQLALQRWLRCCNTPLVGSWDFRVDHKGPECIALFVEGYEVGGRE